MKKSIFLLILLLMTLGLSSQQQYEVSVINVIVPVRVFDGGNFVDNLTIEDFELYEDGKLQKIEALYLTKKTQIERREETRDFMPYTQRRFYFLFQLTDYNPKISEAMNHFFTHVFVPGDTLEVMSPMKNYTLSPKALKSKPKEEIAKDLINILVRDTKIGSSEYRSLINELKSLVRGISGQTGIGRAQTGEESSSLGITYLLPRYREALDKLETLRIVDEKKFLAFAAKLRRMEGQKNVFFFYQREFRPEIQPRVMNLLMSQYQDQPNIQGDLQDLMQFYHRHLKPNVDRIKQAFADSSIFFNFIFMHRDPENVSGIQMVEQSEDIFEIFSQIAEATGGVVDSSQNPAAAFKNGIEIAENCYLLYYHPANYKRDRKYRNIEVKIKNKGYRIVHRQGYFADR